MSADNQEKRWGISGSNLFGKSISANYLENVIKNCPAAVSLASADDFRIVVDSQKMEELIRCSKPRTGSSLKLQWSNSRNFDELMSRFASDGRLEAQEVRFQRNDGEQFWAAISARGIQVEGQDYLFLYARDLTDQLADKLEISRQRDALHDAEKLSALGQLLGGISHELNNPLSVLSGQALMLKEQSDDEKTAKRADRILKAADRCTRIVRSFLDLARSKSPDLIAVDLNEMVAEAVEDAGKTIREMGAEVILDLPRTVPRIMADPNQIRQVFVNLIVNASHALKSSEGVKRITVRSKYMADSEQVELLFSDTGSGIPEAVSSRIFDPLFTTKNPGKGTGLGLALCRRILEAHNGTIELRSTSSHGTSFKVTFSEIASSGSIPEPILVRASARGDSMNVLVMDNRIEAGETLAEIVSARGHGVEFVEAAFVGFERLRRREFDAIFFQVGFGDMNLPSAVKSIEKAQRGASRSLIFVLSADASDDAHRQIEEMERPYLTEPLSERDVLEMLELLALRKAA